MDSDRLTVEYLRSQIGKIDEQEGIEKILDLLNSILTKIEELDKKKKDK